MVFFICKWDHVLNSTLVDIEFKPNLYSLWTSNEIEQTVKQIEIKIGILV